MPKAALDNIAVQAKSEFKELHYKLSSKSDVQN